MIELQDIRKVFQAGRANEHVALDQITLNIRGQQLTVLKGPSGSGKTTLLSILGCLARPTSGRIKLRDKEITSLPDRFLTGIRRESFGFIFQHFNLVPGISVIENVMLPAYPTGEKAAAIKERAGELLHLFNLEAKTSAKVQWLSGGEAQRVAIARALINNPEIIIADEPTAHLDTALSRDFLKIVEQFKIKGKTVLIASHDPLIYEADIVDRVIEMRDGRIKAGGAA
jgi:putative ABC transport system ATP-binding protein